ncbi:BQ2448_3500 [Microbotryum intermedium]|uniref:BQ2448_3500 protein n=1 Tax=Microbotryum intermedium TaxID=269621 RepID=A0A238FHU7_9BASI|nr:BQ2448_3500 [Microbotryum intermedium]
MAPKAPSRGATLAGPSTAASSQQSVNRAEPKIALVTSKEWVVPPRPKPGRKPSKPAESSSKKTTQRAFRERRQEYIAELEEKVRALEAGEGDKAVFFQSQAVKAKEESTQLRIENEQLRKQVAELQVRVGEAIDSHAPSPSSSSSSPSNSTRPSKATSAPTTKRPHSSRVMIVEEAQEPARRPKRSRQASNASTTSAMVPDESPREHIRTPLASISHIIHAADIDAPRGADYALEGSCGFCSTESCLCSQVSEYAAPTPVEDFSIAEESAFPTSKRQLSSAATLPAISVQISVPLNLRRRAGGAPVKSVWKLEPAPAPASSSKMPTAKQAPVCSGDPSNCPACADDPFGKAFCESLSQSVCSTTPCANCPSRHQPPPNLKNRMPTPPPSVEELDAEETAALLDTFTDLPCCGQPSLCGSATCVPEEEQHKAEVKQRSSDSIEMLPKSVPSGVRTEDIPCSEAWSVLKSHPNIAFTNLQMLADVVAKRTRCDGATSSPALEPIRSSDELLVQRRRLTVERGAVDQALELLDQGSLRR